MRDPKFDQYLIERGTFPDGSPVSSQSHPWINELAAANMVPPAPANGNGLILGDNLESAEDYLEGWKPPKYLEGVNMEDYQSRVVLEQFYGYCFADEPEEGEQDGTIQR